MDSDDTVGVLVRDVRRSFGPVTAVQGVSFVAHKGQITGLVGPNGAGKTTLLLMLATLLEPDAGEIKIGSFDPSKQTDAVRARMGWAPDVFGMYDNLSIREFMTYAAASYRLDKAVIPERVDELIEAAGFTDRADRPVHELSRGQKQRLSLMRSVVHQPDVLLLDEPASGLDPGGRIELRKTLRGFADNGMAIVISSHLLDDLDEMADSVVFMNNGTSVGQHAVAELQSSRQSRLWRVRALSQDALMTALRNLGVTFEVHPSELVELEVSSDDEAATLLESLVHAGVRVTSFAPHGGNIEAEYLRITEGER